MSDLPHDGAAPQTEACFETRTARILIVGGGFAGIGMAIRLRQQGIDDFVILERARDAGGTWRDNSYPGCACDVQSSLYSFSFAPNPEWSRVYAPQPEIWDYLRRVVREYDIGRHFVYGENVTGAEWDDLMQQWVVTSTSGEWTADAMVLASGGLSDPIIPAIPGLDTFEGPVFHSARWDHDCSLEGKRVAVIGTGASAIQFVPQIQPRVAHLDLYQRTPAWILPRHDTAIPEWRKSLYRSVPAAQRLQRAALYALREMLLLPFRKPALGKVVEARALQHMRAQIPDESLRAKLVPRYRIGCKRILVSDDFYPAIAQPNVTLVTDAIASITPNGVTTADCVHHMADVIILGTGFHTTDPPLAPLVRGRTEKTLAEVWAGSPRAYMGTTETGFPNLFFLLGPNTALGHSSVVLMIEAQIEHVLGVLALTEKRDAGAAEPESAAQKRFVAALDERMASTVWMRGGCSSWYLDATGRNSTLWPDGVGKFSRTVSRVRAADYRFTPRRVTTAEVRT